MAAPNSVETCTEIACKTGLSAGLTAHSVSGVSFRAELIDDVPSGDTEPKTYPAIVLGTGIAVPRGYKDPHYTIPMTISIRTYHPDDLKRETRLGIMESVLHTLRTRDFTSDFSAGTFQSVMFNGGTFRTEERVNIADIETEWHVCHAYS